MIIILILYCVWHNINSLGIVHSRGCELFFRVMLYFIGSVISTKEQELIVIGAAEAGRWRKALCASGKFERA